MDGRAERELRLPFRPSSPAMAHASGTVPSGSSESMIRAGQVLGHARFQRGVPLGLERQAYPILVSMAGLREQGTVTACKAKETSFGLVWRSRNFGLKPSADRWSFGQAMTQGKTRIVKTHRPSQTPAQAPSRPTHEPGLAGQAVHVGR